MILSCLIAVLLGAAANICLPTEVIPNPVRLDNYAEALKRMNFLVALKTL